MHKYISDCLKCSTVLIRSAVLLSLVVVSLCSSPAVAYARLGQGVWVDSIPDGVEFDEPPLESRDAARLDAFAQAVLAEAIEMIPGDLSEARTVLLGDFLTSRAKEYVLSYSVVSVEDLPMGKRLTVDAAINKSALKKTLKHLGIWFTLSEPVGYNPQYSNVPPEIWEELGRMHVLYGLTPNSTAELSLQMEFANEEWQMVLTRSDDGEMPVTVARSSGKAFADAWHAVWGRYFAGVSAAQAGGPSVILTVEGWFSPDGVETFDRSLQSWEGVLDETRLMNVTLKAAGASATWRLVVVDRIGLQRKLDEAFTGRGLVYELGNDEE